MIDCIVGILEASQLMLRGDSKAEKQSDEKAFWYQMTGAGLLIVSILPFLSILALPGLWLLIYGRWRRLMRHRRQLAIVIADRKELAGLKREISDLFIEPTTGSSEEDGYGGRQ